MAGSKRKMHIEKTPHTQPRTRGKIPKPLFEEDILTQRSNGWYINGRKVSREDLLALADEARMWRKSVLWNYMRKQVHYMAYLRATNKARTDKDIDHANAMYASLEVLERFIDRCTAL